MGRTVILGGLRAAQWSGADLTSDLSACLFLSTYHPHTIVIHTDKRHRQLCARLTILKPLEQTPACQAHPQRRSLPCPEAVGGERELQEISRSGYLGQAQPLFDNARYNSHQAAAVGSRPPATQDVACQCRQATWSVTVSNGSRFVRSGLAGCCLLPALVSPGRLPK